MIVKLSSVNVFLTCLLALIAVLGDFIVSHTKINIFQALFDNVTHAVIAGISWFYYRYNFRNHSAFDTLIETAICTIIASLIDVDHFLAAKSFYLKDATNLKSRPFLHCSTYPLLISLIILGFAYVQQNKLMKTFGLILLTAFSSHHTRDATRRGYWLHPFGSTPPIPYFSYVLLTCFIPYFICILHRCLVFDIPVHTRHTDNV